MRLIIRYMALSAIFSGGIMMAQEWKQVQADPALPVKPGFDTNRAIFWAQPNFTPLRDPEWIPLRDALQSGQLEEDVPVLTIRVAGKILTFVTSQMSYHHVAQGDINGEPWMVTF